ncbi:probable tRNA (uracil-O(2)-)-methyltransferase [Eurosta solidaginis]|uniref:probable tRNA (uracil-O(2)-)-methyltransferase n=1 Tax=Eurosta solidaginis TaxID=178769 RepID=UPI003531562F
MDDIITDKQFWTGVGILIQNYHAINRKIFGCILHKVLKVKKGIKIISCKDDQQLQDICLNRTGYDVIEITEAAFHSSLNTISEANSNQDQEQYEGFILVFKFLTKKLQKNIEAIGKIDLICKIYTCQFLSEDLDDYSVQINNGELLFSALDQHALDKNKRWIDFVLKPKLLKWCKKPTVEASDTGDVTKQPKSLQLVDLESYNELYKSLKCKYAHKALMCWKTAKESTDPLKFIYEDLAISAYLISVWKRVGPPTGFADLGCGNGLLVYILSEEGYNGYGYDVRARKIWSCYPKTTRLIEQTIEPQIFKAPEDVDWLIGNHSDELSPWVPILAATRSFQTHYFLLPCCAYELSGAKFQRRNTGSSVYKDFYAYLQTLSQKCGYATLKDRLKIPSTKRLALVGYERTHSRDDFDKKLKEIANLVEEERMKYGNGISEVDIKLRDRNELVRNCTKIDKNIIDALVLKIFQQLLSAASIMPEKTNEEANRWQCGNALRMCEIVKSLDKNELQNIKAECGGIKTLLRNKHEIFEFIEKERVRVRKPQLHVATQAKEKLQTVKKRNCFFFLHHPDGCPLLDEQCSFIH